MNRIAALVCLLTVITGCAAKETAKFDSGSAQACVGGFMAKRGLVPWPTCIIPFADGGKSCSDKGDCKGKCLVKYHGNLAIGSPATGQCQAEEPAIGCFAQVRDGTVSTKFLCTD